MREGIFNRGKTHYVDVNFHYIDVNE